MRRRLGSMQRRYGCLVPSSMTPLTSSTSTSRGNSHSYACHISRCFSTSSATPETCDWRHSHICRSSALSSSTMSPSLEGWKFQRRPCSTSAEAAGTAESTMTEEQLTQVVVDAVVKAGESLVAQKRNTPFIPLVNITRLLPEEAIEHDSMQEGLLSYLRRYPKRFQVLQNASSKQWTVALAAEPVAPKAKKERFVVVPKALSLEEANGDVVACVLSALPQDGSAIPVVELYAGLNADARAVVREKFKSLHALLRIPRASEKISVSPDGTLVKLRAPIAGDPAATHEGDGQLGTSEFAEEEEEELRRDEPPTVLKGRPSSSTLFGGAALPAPPPPPAAGFQPTPPRPAQQQSSSKPSAASSTGGNVSVSETILSDLPPLPDKVPDHTKSEKGAQPEVYLTVEHFVTVIPDFFVPVPAILANLPGYSEGHLQHYLANSKSVQVLSFGSDRYMRLHGNFGELNMSKSNEAALRYPELHPDPILAESFAAFLRAKHCITQPDGTKEPQWVPVEKLLRSAPQDLVDQLPFQGPASIMFFGQFQNLFGICLEDGGLVALAEVPPKLALTSLNTPCPSACCQLIRLLANHRKADLAILINELDQTSATQILRVYGTRSRNKKEDSSPPSAAKTEGEQGGEEEEAEDADVATNVLNSEAKKMELENALHRLVDQHAPLFSIEGTVIMTRRTREKSDIQTRPLEEQLEYATKRGQKKDIRKLRRKIALQNNPDHPLLDPDRLALTVMEYLPRHRPVKFKKFLHGLPFEIVDMLPADYMKFFTRKPDKFQIFEMHGANELFILRAGIPLPAGHLRTQYEPFEIAQIVAQLLQRKTARSAADLMLFLPRGARAQVKKEYGDLVKFCALYPKYFGLMFANANATEANSLTHRATITLLANPGEDQDPPVILAAEEGSTGAASKATGDEDEEDADDDLE